MVNGFIRKHSSGKYQAVLELEPCGTQRTCKTALCKTRKEAKEALERLRDTYDKAKKELIVTSLDDAIKKFEMKCQHRVELGTLRERTFIGYQDNLKLLRRTFNFKDLGAITTAQYDRYFEYMFKRYSSSYVSKIRTMLLCLLETAEISAEALKRAHLRFTKPRNTIEVQKVLSEDERKRIRNVLDIYKTQYTGHKRLMYYMYHLAIKTGMREGEIAGLKWDCVMFEEKRIIINNNLSYIRHKGNIDTLPKTPRSLRSIAVGDSLLDMLKELMETYRQECYPKSPYVFHNFEGKPVATRRILDTFKQACEDADIERNIVFHELRHTNATTLIGSGINAHTVSLRLGHSSTQVTWDIYSHYLNTADQKASDVVDKLD